jgi:glycosyltransferase involved in cell wall biosynthesis
MQVSENLPKISIVTPSYNQARYLPETIESILGQDYPNLEYIIIDGGSTDGSVDIIKRYESHLAHWVSEKDSGQSEAINKGLRRATGTLFNWINSDDVLFPGALKRIAEVYARQPEADLFVGYGAKSDAEGVITRITVPPKELSMSPGNWSFFLHQQSVFMATETVRRLGGVREDLSSIMDAELYYRIFREGCRYVRAHALIGVIREHAEAKGVARKEHFAAEKLGVLGEYDIHPIRMRAGRAKTRICRLLDGSYLRSFILHRKWQGRRPWEAS